MHTQGKERVCAQISDFTVIFALGMVDKILFPQIEIKLSSYILLYVICMFSMMGFRIFHNGIVAKRMKDFTLQEKHDYNLVIYRENHNKKFFLKSITLLTMAKQDIHDGKTVGCKTGTFPDCSRKSGKKCIEDLLFSACSSIISVRGRIAGRSNWSIALRCLLRPLSCRMMNYRRFSEAGIRPG